MTRPNEQTRLFRALIAKLDPEIRRAIMMAWDEIRAGIDWGALRDALSRQDTPAAIAALNIEPAAFELYRQAVTAAYSQGGMLAATTVNGPPGSTVTFRFDMSNPRAEAWIALNVGQRITRLAEEAIEASRSAILAGYQAGRHPNSIALDLGGRMVGGRRQGGVLGLSGPQTEYVLAMRARLESGDAAELRKVLEMSRRDRRYDRLIHRAIAGERLAKADIDKLVQRYSDQLLALRAETIARTETGQAVMSARKEEWRQACEKLGYPLDAVTKAWRHGGGVREPRWWHIQANGMQVQGLEVAFILANGARMQHALDPAGGASECANCSCDTTFRLDHSWGLT
ncbi:hypothetical protein [Neotabrizicola sp. VNH66]|uniref:hypothetical protein n=1 Tax=Neotabrizicola sp. VNH66 TaxID=3400918 RepID=UPI003C0F3937